MDLDLSSSEVVRYIHEDCLTVCESAGCCRLQDPPGSCCGMGRVSRWGFVFISSILLSLLDRLSRDRARELGYKKVQHAVGPVAMEEDGRVAGKEGRTLRRRGSSTVTIFNGDQPTPIPTDKTPLLASLTQRGLDVPVLRRWRHP